MDGASASSKPEAPTSFLSLPRELRNMIYACVLVDEEYIDLGIRIYRQLSPQLLHTNKTIHDEAAEVLYGHNRFDFTMCYPDDLLPSFLDQIGPDNSKYIRHIRIDFPKFQHLDPGDVTLTDQSVRILEKLKDCCSNLRTLTTSRSSTDNMERRLDSLDHPKVVHEALELVDARFRAISSIPSPDHDSGNPMLSIVVEVYENGMNDDIRRKMESHGWILDTAEIVEEEDRSLGDDIDWDSSSWGRDDGDDYDDDYDIDNDSDFWRRAGD